MERPRRAEGLRVCVTEQGCVELRLGPRGSISVPKTRFHVRHFYDNDPGQPFTRWADFMVKAAELARDGVKAAYGPPPRFTYAVGTSNGGYQVRRAVEIAPKLFDGGVDWEGTFVDEHAPNILTDLPPAILNFPQYASGISFPSAAATLAGQNIQAAGYPPDIVSGTTSLWGLYNTSFWEVTQCQWQKRLDPTYDTYVSGTGTYNYVSRLSVSDVGAQLAAFATTGDIQRPLVPSPAPWTRYCPSITTRAPMPARSRLSRKIRRGQGGNDKHQPATAWGAERKSPRTFPRHIHDGAQLIELTRSASICLAQVERSAVPPPDRCPARRPNRYTCAAGQCEKPFAP